MKDITLYAYSTDRDFLQLLTFLLEKVETNIFTSTNMAELEKLYKKGVPNILLLDDADKTTKNGVDSIVSNILKQYVSQSRKEKSTGMTVVLSEQASDIEYKVDLLLNGVDYIIGKPLNMVELIARMTAIVRHQKYVQTHFEEKVQHIRNIASFDFMDKVLVYLNEHIKPIVESYIDDALNSPAKDGDIHVYKEKITQDMLQIKATLNALRDDVYGLLEKESDAPNDWEHLEMLFKKNLDLINLAYHSQN